MFVWHRFYVYSTKKFTIFIRLEIEFFPVLFLTQFLILFNNRFDVLNEVYGQVNEIWVLIYQAVGGGARHSVC